MIHFTAEQEKRGLIRVDSEKSKQLGLTSDRFTEDSYLWLEGNTLHLSLLTSKKEHQGYVLNILKTAKVKGYDMLCYPVSERMKMILSRFGFVITQDGWLYKNTKQEEDIKEAICDALDFCRAKGVCAVTMEEVFEYWKNHRI